MAEAGGKRRPVLVLTRDEVLDVRALVTVAEITTRQRGLAVEVELDSGEVGLDHDSVVNCDGLHTVALSRLTQRVGRVSPETLDRVCGAVGHALGC